MYITYNIDIYIIYIMLSYFLIFCFVAVFYLTDPGLAMAAHTDPGLFTAKFLSETPGLELLDVPWRCLVVGYGFFVWLYVC